MGSSADEIIGNVTDVANWLCDEGYCAAGKDTPIKKSKIYQDRKNGVLVISDAKAITLQEVESYITRAMLVKRTGAGSRKGEIEDLSALRARRELEKLEIEIDTKRMALQKEIGQLLPKQEVYLQMSIKIAAFESSIKHLVRSRAVDWITAVGGDQKKIQALLDMIYPEIDDLLDRMGRLDDLKVVVVKRQEPV